MSKYVIMSLTGKPVQTWTFAGKKKIIFCQSLDWALKSDDEMMMGRQLEFLKKHFPEQSKDLRVMRVAVTTNIKIG